MNSFGTIATVNKTYFTLQTFMVSDKSIANIYEVQYYLPANFAIARHIKSLKMFSGYTSLSTCFPTCSRNQYQIEQITFIVTLQEI